MLALCPPTTRRSSLCGTDVGRRSGGNSKGASLACRWLWAGHSGPGFNQNRNVHLRGGFWCQREANNSRTARGGNTVDARRDGVPKLHKIHEKRATSKDFRGVSYTRGRRMHTGANWFDVAVGSGGCRRAFESAARLHFDLKGTFDHKICLGGDMYGRVRRKGPSIAELVSFVFFPFLHSVVRLNAPEECFVYTVGVDAEQGLRAVRHWAQRS